MCVCVGGSSGVLSWVWKDMVPCRLVCCRVGMGGVFEVEGKGYRLGVTAEYI